MESKNVFIGVVLVVAGLIMALSALNLIPHLNFLFFLAVAFLVAYFVFNRNIGFLIPGCILAAVATFITLVQHGFNGTSIIILLGLAFIAIFLIHTVYIKTNQWGERFWPLFPGTILVIVGTLILNAQLSPQDPARKLTNAAAPALLIILGVIILFGGKKKSS